MGDGMRVGMSRSIFVLGLGCGLAAAGCKPPAQPQVAAAPTSGTASSLSADSSYTDDDYSYDDDSADGSYAADCDPGSCKKKKITITMRNGATGNKASKFKGQTNTDNTVTFEGESADRGRTIGLSATGLPADADEQANDNSLTYSFTPEDESSGQVTVTARDVSRCIADADGKSSKEEKCRDMDEEGFEKYEVTDTFDYEIKLDPEAKARADAEKQLKKQQQAACTAGMLQAGIGILSSSIQAGQAQQQVNAGGLIGMAGQAAIPCMMQ